MQRKDVEKGIIVNCLGTTVKEFPNLESKNVGTLKALESIDIIEKNEEWAKIRAGRIFGYIQNYFIAEERGNEIWI